MAVDTRERRMSMLNFGDGNHIHVTFEADAGGVEADDKAHLLDLYSGITLAAPVAAIVHRIGWGGGYMRQT